MWAAKSASALGWLLRWLCLRPLPCGGVFAHHNPSLPAILKSASNRSVTESPPSDQRAELMTDCHARFAGRRRPGGGYTYYDFMQDRNFDIVGPNPTAEERKAIDLAYMGFLDSQRREAISAELATRQNERLRADLESARQPVGPPLALLPRNSVPIPAKRPADRSRSAHCEDGSLSCSWTKLSTVVKNAFASSPQAKP